MTPCRELQPLLTDYAAGVATPQERLAVEEHLRAGCDACREELIELQSAAELLLGEEPFPSPPPALRGRILDAIGEGSSLAEVPERSSHRRRLGSAFAVAASLAIIAASVAFVRWRQVESRAVVDSLAETWRGRVQATERELGVRGARLVSLPLDAFQNAVVTHALYDSLSKELHVWATHNPVARRGDPNWAWLLGADGEVLARGELRGGEVGRLAAVLDASRLEGTSARLLLTVEASPDARRPSERVVEEGVLELK